MRLHTAILLASLLSPCCAPVFAQSYPTTLTLTTSQRVKPGEAITLTATLTGKFGVGFIVPTNNSSRGGFINFYQEGQVIGRYDINKTNTQIDDRLYDVGPDGRQVIYGLGSRAIGTLTVTAPSQPGTVTYYATFAGNHANPSSATPVTVRVGGAQVNSAIAQLLLDD